MLLQETTKRRRTLRGGVAAAGGGARHAPSGGALLFLTQQQELALVSVEPQELAAEVLDVGCQAVLPQQHGKVLQLQCSQPLTQLHEHTHTESRFLHENTIDLFYQCVEKS